MGFRLLVRNLAIGLQLVESQGRREHIRGPIAVRAEHVDGLGSFVRHGRLLLLRPLDTDGEHRYHLDWSRLTVQVAA